MLRHVQTRHSQGGSRPCACTLLHVRTSYLRPEIGVSTVKDFKSRRATQWNLLFKREAKALEGEMRQKREKDRHELVLDPYGHVRQEIASARQAAYGAAHNSQKSPKSNRKRSRKRGSGNCASQSQDVDGADADFSPQNSPPAKESRMQVPADQMSPSAPRVQASGRRLRSI